MTLYLRFKCKVQKDIRELLAPNRHDNLGNGVPLLPIRFKRRGILFGNWKLIDLDARMPANILARQKFIPLLLEIISSIKRHDKGTSQSPAENGKNGQVLRCKYVLILQ